MDDITKVFETIKETEFSLDSLSTSFDEIYKNGHPPVPIQQFLDDDYYFGATGKEIYPENRSDIEDIFDPRNNYAEVIFGGAIGWGKSFLVEISLCYMVYVLSCYLDPHKWIGASAASPIIFMNMSMSNSKAREVIFSKVKQKIDRSPYFREQFPRAHILKNTLEWSINPKDRTHRTGQQIILRPGTGESLSALGDDIYGGACDELNFFRVIEKSKRAYGETFDPAQDLYNTLSRRMKSRFQVGGQMLGKLFLLSSAQIPEDFIERRIEEATRTGELGKSIKVVKKSLWEGKKGVRSITGQLTYSGKSFRVEVGTSNRNSRLIDTYNKETGVVDQIIHEDIQGKVIHPPVELYIDFTQDIEGCVRDYGGEVTRAIAPFFASVEPIYEAIELGEADKPNDKPGLKHPWSKESTTLQDGSSLIREVLFKKDKDDKWVLKRDPRKPRYFQGDWDLSGDAFGLAIVHVSNFRRSHTGQGQTEDLPIIEVDLVLKIVAPPGGEVNYGNIRAVLFNLVNHGMRFRYGSFDLKNATADMIQILNTNGIQCGYLSVDKTPEPYYTLKDAFYDTRIWMYNYQPLVTELIRLEKRIDKIDHPPNGSKDLSDAMAGAVWQAFTHEMQASPEIMAGRLPVKDAIPVKDTMKQRMLSAEDEMREFMGGSKEVK